MENALLAELIHQIRTRGNMEILDRLKGLGFDNMEMYAFIRSYALGVENSLDQKTTEIIDQQIVHHVMFPHMRRFTQTPSTQRLFFQYVAVLNKSGRPTTFLHYPAEHVGGGYIFADTERGIEDRKVNMSIRDLYMGITFEAIIQALYPNGATDNNRKFVEDRIKDLISRERVIMNQQFKTYRLKPDYANGIHNFLFHEPQGNKNSFVYMNPNAEPWEEAYKREMDERLNNLTRQAVITLMMRSAGLRDDVPLSVRVVPLKKEVSAGTSLTPNFRNATSTQRIGFGLLLNPTNPKLYTGATAEEITNHVLGQTPIKDKDTEFKIKKYIQAMETNAELIPAHPGKLIPTQKLMENYEYITIEPENSCEVVNFLDGQTKLITAQAITRC